MSPQKQHKSPSASERVSADPSAEGAGVESLVGRVVRADPWCVRFFYPSFAVRDALTYSDYGRDVIWCGRSRKNLGEWLGERCGRWISVVGEPEVDFSDRASVVGFVTAARGKRAPRASVNDVLLNADDEYFWYLVKTYWVSGRWAVASGGDATVFDLFRCSTESLKDTLAVWFELIEDTPAEVVESSFLTFLSRVANLGDQTVKPGYLKVLKKADRRFGGRVRPGVLRYAQRRDRDVRLGFVDLVTDLLG